MKATSKIYKMVPLIIGENEPSRYDNWRAKVERSKGLQEYIRLQQFVNGVRE